MQRMMRNAITGLAALVLGTTGCVSGRAPLATHITTTEADRFALQFEDQSERALDKKVFAVQDGVLYTTIDSYDSVMGQINDHANVIQSKAPKAHVSVGSEQYAALCIGDTLRVKYTNPETGQEIMEEQMIGPDRTIDLPGIPRMQAADRTAAEVEKDILEATKKDPTVQVINSAPFAATAYSPFAGAVNVVEIDETGQRRTARLGYPYNATKVLTLLGGVSNTQKVAVIRQCDGEYEGETFDRVVILGNAQRVAAGLDNMGLRHNDTVLAYAQHPVARAYRDGKAFVTEITDFIQTLEGPITAWGNLDNAAYTVGHRTYIPDQPSGMDKAIERTGQVKTLLDNVAGIGAHAPK